MKYTILLILLSSFSTITLAQHNHQKDEMDSKSEMMLTLKSSKISTSVIQYYLELKNALINDDNSKASELGVGLKNALLELDISSFTQTNQTELKEIIENAIENSEHITANKNEISHQREHLVILSIDLYDLLHITGSDRTLYKLFCPMFKDGAYWLSESKVIKNPYYGSKMLTCGKLQQIISIK